MTDTIHSLEFNLQQWIHDGYHLKNFIDWNDLLTQQTESSYQHDYESFEALVRTQLHHSVEYHTHSLSSSVRGVWLRCHTSDEIDQYLKWCIANCQSYFYDLAFITVDEGTVVFHLAMHFLDVQDALMFKLMFSSK